MVWDKRWKLVIAIAALAVTLAACTGSNEGGTPRGEEPPAASEPAKETPTPAPTDAGAGVDKPNDSAPASPAPGKKLSELPEQLELKFTLEGMEERTPATLMKSEQGYAIYVMDGFEFSMEEPGKDIIFHENFPEYYTRIEVLDAADTNLDDIRTNAKEWLKAATSSDAIEMKEDQIPESIRNQTRLFLHASNAEGTINIAVIEAAGGLFLCTLSFPLGEAAEGVTPRFYPMLATLTVVEEG